MNIAVAKDEAFNFTYKANTDALARLGDLRFFSPIGDSQLPLCDLLYLPGGYPELYAPALSANSGMRQSIRTYVEQGGLTFAECGGFMYLCNKIDGNEMCGVFNMNASMQNAHLHLGYRSMLVNGIELHGHEFHYSDIDTTNLSGDVVVNQCQTSANGEPVTTAIYQFKRTIAGYTHWYWAEKGFENTWLKELMKL